MNFRSVSLSIAVAAANPGVETLPSGSSARLLALDELSLVGRREAFAFSSRSFVGSELIHGRLTATYMPPDLSGVLVRAAWSPLTGREGVDLEIQAQAESAARFAQLEVGVSSQWTTAGRSVLPRLASRVESRDARAASHSYDGREPPAVLRGLTTLPLATSWASALAPLVVRVPGVPRSLHYVEMVQPDDVARRIVGVPADERAASELVLSVRYGLLGHDLEKGVILRARLRGVWIESESPESEAAELWREFLAEPLPLGP